MEYEMEELNVETLRKEILRKCKKGPGHLIPRDEAKDNERWQEDIQKDTLSMRTDEAAEEDLPLEEILAEKRRKYTAKEEFVYSLYNDILPSFIVEWTGYFLRKAPLPKRSSSDDVDFRENALEIDDYPEDYDLPEEDWERKDKVSVSPWRFTSPDEFADIKFYNNNSYSGRISRKMMEGVGTYTWRDGVRYKGQFEQNQIRGKGLLEWSDDCWYEGDFVDGYRHDKGIMVDKRHNRVYIGQWHANKKL